ncbi:NAD(P)-binding protein [Mycolicibacterium baixiangningiae]|uniref:NAD(P)-binding protein n=1 Tax=Mycolicibacterium baixiangningiae TaxID=2761578 RepID=UPI0018662DC4
MRVGIVGGGFAGLAAALAFRQSGNDVSVFERSAGPPVAGGAISLAPNALACLSVLGVRERVETEPWSRMPATVRTAAGCVLVRRTLAQLTGGDHYAAVPRGQLLGWLAERLPPDCLHYSSAVTGVRTDGVLVVGETGGQRRGASHPFSTSAQMCRLSAATSGCGPAEPTRGNTTSSSTTLTGRPGDTNATRTSHAH